MTETTVERMQVEFSTNLAELIANLHTVENELESVNDAFVRSETASQTYAESMAQAGSAAAASSSGIATLADGMDGFAASSATGAAAASLYAGSLDATQEALTTFNIRMDHAAGKFDDVNAAANGTATAIGRINNVSNNAYTTFARLASNSTTAAKAITKLSTETRSLASAYTTASTGSETFMKSVGDVGTAAGAAVSQVNEYSAAISTAGSESAAAADAMEMVAEKTGRTEGAMGKLSGVAGKVFTGFSAATLLSTLDTIIARAEAVSQRFQNLGSDIATSLGSASPGVAAELNAVVNDLIGTVPATQVDDLGKGVALLHKYLADMDMAEFKDLMLEYASYADIWNMNLTDLISATQKLFTKYDITTAAQMKDALAMINAVNNLAPDAVPSSVISILNNNRQAIGAQGWSFTEALSRIVNAGNDRAMSKFQEYLNALQTVKATKGTMFSSDEAFAAWIRAVTETVRNAESETEAQNIIMTEYGIRGTSAMEIAKYLRLETSDRDRTNEIRKQSEKNRSGYSQYRRQETSGEAVGRAKTVTTQADKTLGDGVLDVKRLIAEQNAYDRKMYKVASMRPGELASYVESIPVIGEILSPFTGLVKSYIPEINIKMGIRGTVEDFIERYETRMKNNEFLPFDENYYLSYQNLAKKIGVNTSDMKFSSGTDMWSVMEDVKMGVYADLLQRVHSVQKGEEAVPLVDITKDVVESSGTMFNVENFTGAVYMSDGTVIEGQDAISLFNTSWTVKPLEEEKSVFDTIGDFFAGLFSSAEAPETATVSGDFAAVAGGDANVSAAGNMTVAAEQATIVAGYTDNLTPPGPAFDPKLDQYPAFTGTAAYHATADPVELPTPAVTLEAPANTAGVQASVGFAELSMALARSSPASGTDGGILQELRAALAGLETAVLMLGTRLHSESATPFVSNGDTLITQNFYVPEADSYSVRNAAVRAVRASQAGACKL